MNPLMQMMNGGAPTPQQNGLSQLAGVMRMLRSGNPEQIAQQMMQQNPQFKAFLDANRGKTPDQVAKEHGIDLSQFMKQM